MSDTPAVPTTPERIFADHRKCGSPNGYDGCYSHPVSGVAHCRQDGMDWPCDVELLRPARSTPAEALDERISENVGVFVYQHRMRTALAAFEEWARVVIPMLRNAGDGEAADFGEDRIAQSQEARLADGHVERLRQDIEKIDHPCHDVCVGNLHADCQCAAWIRQEVLSLLSPHNREADHE